MQELQSLRRSRTQPRQGGKDSPFDPYHPTDEDVYNDKVGNPSPVERFSHGVLGWVAYF